MDLGSSAKLLKVHPLLSEKVTRLLTLLADFGDYRVTSGLRTFAEQDALYTQGRTKPGERVTNARAGQSNHNYGLAVDITHFKNGQPDWNTISAYVNIGHEAVKVGLEWGGDWKKFKDLPHIQLPGLTIAQCQTLYKQGGIEAVWKRASELNHAGPAEPVGRPPIKVDFSPLQRDLKIGDRGDDVKALQTKLGVAADGVFGLKTKKAVLNVQVEHDLRADGIVGKATRAAIEG